MPTCVQVYQSNKDHEFYRKWVPLMDDEDVGDVGVQGFLKVSLQIVGPDEDIKLHDEAEDIAKELENEAKSGGDIST